MTTDDTDPGRLLPGSDKSRFRWPASVQGDTRNLESPHWLANLRGSSCLLNILRPSSAFPNTFVAVDPSRVLTVDLWIIDRWIEPGSIEGFLSLARTLAQTSHPSIMTILDAGVYEERPFLLLPHLEGQHLKSRITQRPFTVAEAVELSLEMANAVSCLHEAGLDHLGLITVGVFLSDDRTVRLDLRRKIEQMVYMTEGHGRQIYGGITGCEAPEMVRDPESCGRLTDVYALGAILFEMLTGRPALIRGAVGPEAVMNIVRLEPERPRLFNKKVDHTLESICLRCLDKDPKKRFDSAKSLADALTKWQSGAGRNGWFWSLFRNPRITIPGKSNT